MKNKEVTVYLDGVDFQHEIGEASDGNKVYPSIKDLQSHNSCWESCGIVKVKLVFEEWAVAQNFNDMIKNAVSLNVMDENERWLKASEKHLHRLKEMVINQENRIKMIQNKIKENS